LYPGPKKKHPARKPFYHLQYDPSHLLFELLLFFKIYSRRGHGTAYPTSF
jgi:hypothetical protein